MTRFRRFLNADSGGERTVLRRNSGEWAYVGVVPAMGGGLAACMFIAGRSSRNSATSSDLAEFQAYRISCSQLRKSVESQPFLARTRVTTRIRAKEAALATLEELPGIGKKNGWTAEKLREQRDLVRGYANSIDVMDGNYCDSRGGPFISFRKYHDSFRSTNEVIILDNITYLGTSLAQGAEKIIIFVSRSSKGSEIGRTALLVSLNRNKEAMVVGSGYLVTP